MKSFLKTNELIEALNNRYAVKKFEKRNLSETEKSELEDTVKSILQLTPTSFGLQAYKFINVKNTELREQLKKYSWDQSQITDSDILIVFAVPTNFDRKFIEKHTENLQKIRGITDEKKASVTDFIVFSTIENGKSIGLNNFEDWLTYQVYIALGNLMTGLAVLGIDACPIEGFSNEKYDELLNLKEKNLSSKVILAIGKRGAEDKYQNEKKVRFPKEELFIDL
ncbi:hypothetical protein BLD25_00100 [Candidatus Gracilibacteria bacterium GN02-872]|nr:hypothetical protein BLD25_00100 [Candidatus Gracilibacteria bacterium GN02-872]